MWFMEPQNGTLEEDLTGPDAQHSESLVCSLPSFESLCALLVTASSLLLDS